MEDSVIETLTYLSKRPNMEVLHRQFEEDRQNNTGWNWQCVDSYNQRRCLWINKSDTQRKDYPGAQPWQGASDQEVPVIGPRIDSLVAIAMNAIRDGQIAAIPIGHQNLERAAETAVFIRWMFDSWIPNSYDEIELSLNNMFEKGIATSYIGWERKLRKAKEILELSALEELAAESEDAEALVTLILDVEREEEAIEAFVAQFDIKKSVARKAVKELRDLGVTEIPVVRGDIDRPILEAKDSNAEVIMPAYTMHPQNMTRVHVRYFMSAQDLLTAVEGEEWDEKVVEHIIENCMGVTDEDIDTPYGIYGSRGISSSLRGSVTTAQPNDLVEIVRTFERKVDKEDGAIGIYQTVWCPKYVEAELKFDLLNGWDEFPIAITPLTRDTKRIYDVRSIPALLRGNQRQAKIVRDSFNDQTSIALNPPRTHPAGRPPTVWGAGATYAARRGEENIYKTQEVPNTQRNGVEMERYLDAEADLIRGLTPDSPIALQRQQYFVNRALKHVAECARLAYKAYLRYHNDEAIYFRVTGNPEPQMFVRGPIDEEMDIKIYYDVRAMDTEHVDTIVQRLTALMQIDAGNRLDRNSIMDVIVNLTVPQFANRVLRSNEEAEADVLKKVSNDLALIWSGQSVGAQPQGGEIAMQYIEGVYLQKPNVQERLQTDPTFAQDLQLYMGQYQQQMQQQQNAVTGRLGTEAAELQGVNVGEPQ